MHVDRRRFLLIAASLCACQAAQRDKNAAQPVTVPAPPPGASTAAPAPPPTAPRALLARCERMGPKREGADCEGEPRREMCLAFAEEFSAPFAEAGIACLEAADDCDTCEIGLCAMHALEKAPNTKIAECEGTGYDEDDQVIVELCHHYASGMTQAGRTRFTKCLRENRGLGVRFCLWDPSSTPCTEGGHDLGY